MGGSAVRGNAAVGDVLRGAYTCRQITVKWGFQDAMTGWKALAIFLAGLVLGTAVAAVSWFALIWRVF